MFGTKFVSQYFGAEEISYHAASTSTLIMVRHNYATSHMKAHEWAFCNNFTFLYHDRWDFELGELVVIPAFWLRSKCHLASQKDTLQKGAWNTFNFLQHFAQWVLQLFFNCINTHQKLCTWCQQHDLYCPKLFFKVLYSKCISSAGISLELVTCRDGRQTRRKTWSSFPLTNQRTITQGQWQPIVSKCLHLPPKRLNP